MASLHVLYGPPIQEAIAAGDLPRMKQFAEVHPLRNHVPGQRLLQELPHARTGPEQPPMTLGRDLFHPRQARLRICPPVGLQGDVDGLKGRGQEDRPTLRHL